ncbi:MAG: Gfo/Idh/MocA family oxidoreductase [Deltaproteobacteria bacterium]|nr:Gfo/Idh/MocA family oxidoreductase [Deltaproteobacteria bacterium]
MKAENKIRWGIVSAANITSRVIPAIRMNSNSVVSAIASRDYNKARTLARKYGIERICESYEEILDSDKIDAVYIPLINSLHFKWSYRALQKGINVLCEKPFTLNSGDAKKLIDYAGRNNLVIREAFMYRFHPQYKLIMKMIKRKRIGKIKSIYSVFTFFNDDPASYLLSSKYGGGSLMDVGCYCIHLSRMIAGREPKGVFALKNGKGVDKNMRGILDFGDIKALFEASICEYERHYAVIRGEKGEIEIFNPWAIKKKTVVVIRSEGVEDTVRFPYYNPYRLEIEDFISAILKKRRKNNYDSYLNMKVIDSLRVSAKYSRYVVAG